MKLTFIRLAMAAEIATGTQPVDTAKPEPTSPKLDELKKQYAEAWQKMISITDPLSKDAKDAKMAVWKLDGEMKSEIGEIVKRENEARMAELRNERLKLVATLLDAHKAFVTAPKNTPADKLAELEGAFTTAREVVDNELLAKYAHSKPAKKAETSEGDNSASNGEASANKAAILEMYAAGKSHKDIEAAGYKRSTVWHVIDKAIKAGEVTKH